MKDNLSIIITMLIFVILIIIFPLYNYFERQDDMSYNLALKATTNFVDEVMQSGYLTQEMYAEYVSELADTGNLYDIQLEAHNKILTENVTTTGTYDEQYKISYNKDIFNTVENPTDIMHGNVVKDGIYHLNEGDQFYVKLKNSNTTMAGAIFNTIVPTSSKERIAVNYGGVIKNQAWEKVDAKYYDKANAVSNKPDIHPKSLITTTGDITNLDDSIIVSNSITLFPTQDSITFSATGPESPSWWNKIDNYSWQIDSNTPTLKGKNEEFKLENALMNEGDHVLYVRGVDSVGNQTDARTLNIKVTRNVSGGSGEGGFNGKDLIIDIPKFVNAWPTSCTLTVYLSNGHSYGGDTFKVEGFENGVSKTIINKNLYNIMGRDWGEVTNYNRNWLVDSKAITTKGNVDGITNFLYKDDTITKIISSALEIKIELDFSNLNNNFDSLKIKYTNDHYPGCIIRISSTLGGAYKYTINYDNE